MNKPRTFWSRLTYAIADLTIFNLIAASVFYAGADGWLFGLKIVVFISGLAYGFLGFLITLDDKKDVHGNKIEQTGWERFGYLTVTIGFALMAIASVVVFAPMLVTYANPSGTIVTAISVLVVIRNILILGGYSIVAIEELKRETSTETLSDLWKTLDANKNQKQGFAFVVIYVVGIALSVVIAMAANSEQKPMYTGAMPRWEVLSEVDEPNNRKVELDEGLELVTPAGYRLTVLDIGVGKCNISGYGGLDTRQKVFVIAAHNLYGNYTVSTICIDPDVMGTYRDAENTITVSHERVAFDTTRLYIMLGDTWSVVEK